MLVARGRLKDGDLGRARRLHEEAPEGTLTALMARLGLVSERDLAQAWAELLQVPLLSARDAPELPPADLEISLRFLKQQHVVPVRQGEDGLALIVSDPADPYPLQAVQLAAGQPVALCVGLRSEIDGLIERYYGQGRSAMGTIVENLDGSAAEEEDVEHLRDLASEAPVIRLVNLILQRAVEQRASDVHIEPFENRLKVRYRIDGVLHEVEAPPSVIHRGGDLAREDHGASSTSPSAACRRTAASSCACRARSWTCACPPCRPASASRW